VQSPRELTLTNGVSDTVGPLDTTVTNLDQPEL
jgi:cell division protease FtsH